MSLPPAEVGELEAFRSLLAGQPGAHVLELGGALCTALDQLPTSALLNRALGLGLAEPATEELLDGIDGFFAGAGVAYGITVTPDVVPPELPDLLRRRGFGRGYAWTKFTRPPTPAARGRTELRVERIGAHRAAQFSDVFTRAYGMPDLLRPRLERLASLEGWHCFAAYAGDLPAATAALYVTGGVGWLGMAATLPELRGHGAQTALLAERIEAGRKRGCSLLVTETEAPRDGRPGGSYRNIVRAGFEPTYVRQNYLSTRHADAVA
jgi:GNAT superfamily N-acetyltransferase